MAARPGVQRNVPHAQVLTLAAMFISRILRRTPEGIADPRHAGVSSLPQQKLYDLVSEPSKGKDLVHLEKSSWLSKTCYHALTGAANSWSE